MSLSALSDLLLSAGCADDATPGGATVTRRDSAGISIIETGAALWKEGEAWSIDTTPIASVGGVLDDTASVFSWVTGAARIADGSMVVADASTSRLLLFDPLRKLVRTAGRQGEGPGEFWRLDAAAPCGSDEVWVASGDQRISIWTAQLEFQRE